MARKYKTVYEEDGFRIQFMELTNRNGDYVEHGIYGKYSQEKGKWNEVFKIRVMDNKQGGVGYLVVLNNINWKTGVRIKRPEGFIARTDSELLERVEELNSDLLDKLHAQILSCKMR